MRALLIGVGLALGAVAAVMGVNYLMGERESAPESVIAAADHEGARLYRAFGCFKCHGSNLKGTHKGPPLLDVATHWDKDVLVIFMIDPAEYPMDERLERLAERYDPITMPSWPAPKERLELVVDYLMVVSQ